MIPRRLLLALSGGAILAPLVFGSADEVPASLNHILLAASGRPHFSLWPTSKNFKIGVFRPVLKSPRMIATPKITDVTVLLTDCMLCMSVP